MSVASDKEKNSRLTGPYDSLRDFVHAIEAHGKLMRLKEIDQDKYEAPNPVRTAGGCSWA